MPLVRRKPLSFTIEQEGAAPVIVDVPYGGAKDPRETAFWDQLIYNNSYQTMLAKLKELWPEAAEVVPCIIEKEALPKRKETGRVNHAQEYRLERADRKIAEAIAKNYDKFQHYRAEDKQDALDQLLESLDMIEPLYKEFKCETPKKKKEEKKKE